MRIRITQPLNGSIDGIQLDRFILGLTYDVGTTLGNYLLAEGKAEPVESETPALVLPIYEVQSPPQSNADDRAPRRRRKGNRGRK